MLLCIIFVKSNVSLLSVRLENYEHRICSTDSPAPYVEWNSG